MRLHGTSPVTSAQQYGNERDPAIYIVFRNRKVIFILIYMVLIDNSAWEW